MSNTLYPLVCVFKAGLKPLLILYTNVSLSEAGLKLLLEVHVNIFIYQVGLKLLLVLHFHIFSCMTDFFSSFTVGHLPSLISEDWVVTAAHCCDGMSASSLGVAVGSHHLHKPDKDQENIAVAKVLFLDSQFNLALDNILARP